MLEVSRENRCTIVGMLMVQGGIEVCKTVEKDGGRRVGRLPFWVGGLGNRGRQQSKTMQKVEMR